MGSPLGDAEPATNEQEVFAREFNAACVAVSLPSTQRVGIVCTELCLANIGHFGNVREGITRHNVVGIRTSTYQAQTSHDEDKHYCDPEGTPPDIIDLDRTHGFLEVKHEDVRPESSLFL